jgi:CRISPR-associated protein Cmr1
MISELKVELEVVTPLFMSGAEPDSELRAPSLKGLLRFWYRAIDPEFNRPWKNSGMSREFRLFGGTAQGAGQCPFLLQIESPQAKSMTWSDIQINRFSQGAGNKTRNGLVYLGFPFQMSDKNKHGVKRAIAPGRRFTVRCIVPQSAAEEQNSEYSLEIRRVLVASWWLLGHLGGSGSRSRRGFGSLVLRDWKPVSGNWPEISLLPPLCLQTSPAGWRAGLESGLAILRNWFKPFDPNSPDHHPHLGPNFRCRLMDKEFSSNRWDAALADMGDKMQRFRLRRSPDYADVKNHLLAQSKQCGSPLQYAPQRTAFGMPLTFRYSSLKRSDATFLPSNNAKADTHERHGSLLFLKLAAIGKNLHQLFVRLDGDVPGESPPAALQHSRSPLLGFNENIMDTFLDSLSQKG